MAKELKEIIFKEFQNAFGSVDGCVLINYQGLNSEQTQDLRSTLSRGGIEMTVLQNRIARRVFAKNGAPGTFQEYLRGPTAILYGEEGALGASKAIVQWRKKNKNLAAIKGGVFKGKALSVPDVERLASLPDIATLRSTVLSHMLSPMSHLASVAQSLLAHFPGAVKAHREDLEKSQGGEG